MVQSNRKYHVSKCNVANILCRYFHVRERPLCMPVSFLRSLFLHRLCQQLDEGSKVILICHRIVKFVLFFFTYLAYSVEGNVVTKTNLMAAENTEEKLDACCLTEYRPLPGTPNGQIIKVAEFDTYYISGKDQNSKGKVIVLLTDIFGKSLISILTYKDLIRSGKESTYYC